MIKDDFDGFISALLHPTAISPASISANSSSLIARGG
jgi:hypothetical protein